MYNKDRDSSTATTPSSERKHSLGSSPEPHADSADEVSVFAPFKV